MKPLKPEDIEKAFNDLDDHSWQAMDSLSLSVEKIGDIVNKDVPILSEDKIKQLLDYCYYVLIELFSVKEFVEAVATLTTTEKETIFISRLMGDKIFKPFQQALQDAQEDTMLRYIVDEEIVQKRQLQLEQKNLAYLPVPPKKLTKYEGLDIPATPRKPRVQ